MAALAEIPFGEAPSPAYIVHTGLLEANCRLLGEVAARSGARVLLALKGFACHSVFPLIRDHLEGTTASGLHEALLAREYFGKEIHVYCPAFTADDIGKLSGFAHTLVFNSVAQLRLGLDVLDGPRRPEIGLRVNPEYSEVETELYAASAPESRLGVTREALERGGGDVAGALDGLHFHALCEQDADALEHTVEAFESKFGDWIAGRKWVNFGGGHHITRPGYDIERLCRVVRGFRERHGVEVYLEPGEAVALHTGVFAVTVLDVVESGGRRIAIIDASATCHMPDVLEMPYRPSLLGAGAAGERAHTYRIGGLSCLAGDVVGDYSFDAPLRTGDRLAFLDMSHYTMVKTTTFNGVPLPAICVYGRDGGLEVKRRFGYADYAERLS